MASPSQVPPRSDFTVSDFVLTLGMGFVGAFVSVLLLAPGGDHGMLVVGPLLAQSGGHFVGLWAVVRRRGSSFAALGLHVVPSDGVYLFGGVLLQIAIAAASAPIAHLIGAENSTQVLAEQIPTIDSTALRAAMVVSAGLLVPVTEELMYRSLLPRVLRRWMGWTAAYVVAALMFALIHLVGVTGTNLSQTVFLLLPQLFIVGLILGWQARKRRRLGVAIFIHSGFNLVAVLALLFAPGTFT